LTEVWGGGAIWHLPYPKKLMIYLGFPTESEKPEARRTDFSRHFRQLDNPEYNRTASCSRVSDHSSFFISPNAPGEHKMNVILFLPPFGEIVALFPFPI